MTSRKRSGGFLKSRRLVDGTEAVACKSSKIGNWMIWMVHRAHLDDETLVKFEPWACLESSHTHTHTHRQPHRPHVAFAAQSGLHEPEDAGRERGSADFSKAGRGHGERFGEERMRSRGTAERRVEDAVGCVPFAARCRSQGNTHIEQLSLDFTSIPIVGAS